MQSKSGTREQSAGYSWRTVLRSAGIALLSILSLLAVVGLIGHSAIAAGLDSTPNLANGNEVSSGNQVYLPLVAHNYPLPPAPLSVQMYDTINATTGLTWLVASGAKWVRVAISWSTIEPAKTTPRTYDWTSADASILAGSNEGIHFIGTLVNNPKWAAVTGCGPMTNTQDFVDFVGAVAARYQQVTYWEILNEPDRTVRCFGGNGAAYAALLKAVYPAVKAANPYAQVVMGGLAMDFFTTDAASPGPYDSQFMSTTVEACAATPLLPCFDAANFHYYPTYRGRWEPYGRDINGKAAFIRQILANYGYTRPLMNTETGWWPAPTTADKELAARYVVKTLARVMASDMVLANWFALTDSGDVGLPGLLDPNWAPRPAYTALQIAIARLGQAKFVRAIPSSETGASQIEAYQFSVLGATGNWKRLDLYWYECPSMITMIPALPTDCENKAPLQISVTSGDEIEVIDKMGAKTTLDDDNTDGKVTIPGGVGSSPIYIDYQP